MVEFLSASVVVLDSFSLPSVVTNSATLRPSRKLFKSVNMLLNSNLDACYPTAGSDTDLAGAFFRFLHVDD